MGDDNNRDKIIKFIVILSFILIILAIIVFAEIMNRENMDYFDYPSELPVYAYETIDSDFIMYKNEAWEYGLLFYLIKVLTYRKIDVII